MNRIRRARQIWRDQGPRGFWFRLLGALGYRRVQLWQRELTHAANMSRQVTVPADVTITVLKSDQRVTFVRWRADMHANDFQERLAIGDRCWLAQHRNQPIACAWVSTRQARYLCDRFPLQPQEAYLYDMFTDPAWRGRGLAGVLIETIAAHLAGQGYRVLTLALYPENLPAARAYRRAGFQPVIFCARVRIGRWQRDWRHHYRSAINR